MNPLNPLTYSYDSRTDILTVEGMHYSGDLFRAFSIHGLNEGSLIKIVKRDDGIVTLQKVSDFIPCESTN